MLTKGMKIKLVKPMGVFTNVGEVCEIVEVVDNTIAFTFGANGVHLGVMNYDEFEKYFEIYEEPEEIEAVTVDPEYIEYLIEKSDITVDTKYDKCTVVTVKLPNGFVISESSPCVNPAIYDKEMVIEVCMNRIKEKLFELEAYKLQWDLYEAHEAEVDSPCGFDCYLDDECHGCGMCE